MGIGTDCKHGTKASEAGTHKVSDRVVDQAREITEDREYSRGSTLGIENNKSVCKLQAALQLLSGPVRGTGTFFSDVVGVEGTGIGNAKHWLIKYLARSMVLLLICL